MLFLHGHGVSTSKAVRIYKTYGDQARLLAALVIEVIVRTETRGWRRRIASVVRVRHVDIPCPIQGYTRWNRELCAGNRPLSNGRVIVVVATRRDHNEVQPHIA
jgi:hypothetical protein